MCGITGIIYRDKRPVPPDLIQTMTQTLHHRGPDASGVWTEGAVGFGHARLSIIDLENGAQPMSDPTGNITVTYNGEIYNFPELKTFLEKQGRIFRTRCDTEVLLHLWELKGIEMVHDLKGMFAFALYDQNKNQVFMAVDRFGQKPLYYRLDDDLCAFASEPRALRCLSDKEWTLDPASLHHYLSFLAVSPPRTIYKEMNRLAGGRRLLIDLNTHAASEDLWYHLNAQPQSSLTYEEAQEELRRLLKQSVQRRLMSDVPLGAFLSGGVDSAIVVGLLQELSSESVKTFSIGVADPAWDESAAAQRTAKHLGTHHHEKTVDPCQPELFFDLMSHLGEPFADSSLLPTSLVSAFAREQVTVAFSGDAADEAFGGYKRYRAMELAHSFEALPHWIRKLTAQLTSQLLPAGSSERHWLHQAHRFLSLLQTQGLRRYFTIQAHFSEEEKQNLYLDSFFETIVQFDSLRVLEPDFARSQARSLTEKIMDLDVNRYLQDDILVKVDRASMKHSLEVRSPFIDHEVMEFAFSLPKEFKLHQGVGKRILKDTFSNYFPPGHLENKKTGFAVPLGQWFRGPLQPLLHDLLLDDTAKQREIFDPFAVNRLVADHQKGRRDHGQKLWALCCFEAWARAS